MVIRQLNIDGKWTRRSEHIKLHPLFETNRKVFDDEIVFDIDVKDGFERQLVEGIIANNLSLDKYSYSVWDTSRSTHIHLRIKELRLYPKEARNVIRRLFIKKYAEKHYSKVDHRSEDCMIKDFNTIHNITKLKKRKVYEEKFETENIVPIDIKSELSSYYRLCDNVMPLIRKNYDLNNDLMLNYVLSNKIDRDGLRNAVLFKNIAIMLVNSSLDNEQIKTMCRRIADNCKGKKWHELYGWVKWCNRKILEGHNVKVNFRELNKFIKVHNLNINSYNET